MSARDELVDVLIMTRLSDFVPPDGLRLIEQAADAILAAGYRKPRTVTTVEELEALPQFSIGYLDAGGQPPVAWQKAGDVLVMDGVDVKISDYNGATPLVVLFEPEVTE